MKCKVCGNESGKYPLCKACNTKKEQGLVIKCTDCGNWHYKDMPCPQPSDDNAGFLHEPKSMLISKSEQTFFAALKNAVPKEYNVFPQINLAAFIERTDNARFRSELFRNVDFLITDGTYTPKLAVEINDSSHLAKDRRERDEKVSHILEEAGIPLLKLWTSYGVNQEYIDQKINELLNTPVVRKKYSVEKQNVAAQDTIPENTQPVSTGKKKKQGCYIATCVYGSYDCPSVWTLRRFRDDILDKNGFGRLFIKCYYAISPTLVKLFGNTKLFKSFWKNRLDKLVNRLNQKGIDNTKYEDKY